MKSKVGRVVYVAFAAIFALASAHAAPMASQAWTLNVVSNAVVETKEWVVMNYSDGATPINVTNDMWTSNGTTLYFNLNGKQLSAEVLSVETKPQTHGFYVVEDSMADGVVTNGQFYAWIGNGRYHCPANTNIPYIADGGITTQVYYGVTNVYRKINVEEYDYYGTNGMFNIVAWNSQQVFSNAWNIINVSPEADLRSFRIEEGYGDALWNTPVSYMKYLSPSLYECLVCLFFPKAYAETYDINVRGTSGTLSITVKVEGCQPQTTDVSISYSGPYNSESSTTPTPHPNDDGSITYTWKEYSPNPGTAQSDWTSLNYWLPDKVSYSWDYYDDEGQLQHASKTIPRSTLQKILGKQLTDKLKDTWRESKWYDYSKEVPHDCKDNDGYGHYYPKKTCVCTYCGNNRGHNIVSQGEGLCKVCNKKIGWEKKPTDTKCGGHSEDESDHVGWHHSPEMGYRVPTPNNPPQTSGYAKFCLCQCGDKRLSHEYTDDWYYSVGNLTGQQKDDYHCLVTQCDRCENESLFGWRAEVEAHEADPTKAKTVYPFSYIDENGNYIECEPDDPAVNKDYHYCAGTCKWCGWEMKGTARHYDYNNDCVCDDIDCQAVLHNFYDTTCVNDMVCMNCQYHFHRGSDGNPELNTKTSNSSTYCAWHTYGENSKIKEEDGSYNLEEHECLCFLNVRHDHTWEKQDDDTYKCVQSEDGTEGCGLTKDHDQSTHDQCHHFRVHGHCGAWYCDTCNKKVTHDNLGNTYPSSHATFAEYQNDPTCVVSGSFTEDKKFHCAICNHTASGTRCNTVLNANGSKKYKGTLLNGVGDADAWKLHRWHWRDPKEENDVTHVCKCGAFMRNHNPGTKTAQQLKYGPNQVADTTYHSEGYICDRKDANQQPLKDDCYHISTYTAYHNWHDTVNQQGKKTYTSNADGDCLVSQECKTLDADNNNVGCGLSRNAKVSHSWHVNQQMCENVSSDINNNPRHRYTRYCSHSDGNGCGLTVWITNSHHLVEHKNDTATTHYHYGQCENSLYDDLCNANVVTLPFGHHSNFPSWGNDACYWYDNNTYHVKSNKCSKCDMMYATGSEKHTRTDSAYADRYTYIGHGTHVGKNDCSKCGHEYVRFANQLCEYDWGAGSNWQLNSDVYGYDIGTCYWCKTNAQRSHVWESTDNKTHHCKNGGGHLYGIEHSLSPYVIGDVVVCSNCLDCGYSTDPQYEISSMMCNCECGCGHYERHIKGHPEMVVEEWTNCYFWNFAWNCCGCRGDGSCLGGRKCLCENATDILKFSSPHVSTRRYWQGYIGSNKKFIDFHEPVFHVGSEAFGEAFMSMPYLNSVNASTITNVETRGFIRAFSNCTSLVNANFSSLKKAGTQAFKESFLACTNLQSVNLDLLQYAGESSFEKAFYGCGKLKGVYFPSLVDCGTNAFKDAFYGTDIERIDFPNLVHIGSGAFDGSFTQGLYRVKSANFGKLEKIDGSLTIDVSDYPSDFSYVSFDNLKTGLVSIVKMNDSKPLVISASNIGNSAVIDLRRCNNVAEIRFDTAYPGVSYDPRWHSASEWSMTPVYVPGDLYYSYLDWMNTGDYDITPISYPYQLIYTITATDNPPTNWMSVVVKFNGSPTSRCTLENLGGFVVADSVTEEIGWPRETSVASFNGVDPRDTWAFCANSAQKFTFCANDESEYAYKVHAYNVTGSAGNYAANLEFYCSDQHDGFMPMARFKDVNDFYYYPTNTVYSNETYKYTFRGTYSSSTRQYTPQFEKKDGGWVSSPSIPLGIVLTNGYR